MKRTCEHQSIKINIVEDYFKTENMKFVINIPLFFPYTFSPNSLSLLKLLTLSQTSPGFHVSAVQIF